MARRESSTPVLRKLVTTGPKLLAAAKGRTGGDNSVRLTVAARGLNGLNIDENPKNGRVSGPREPVPRRWLLICLATIQDPSASSRVTCLFPTSPHERIVRERKRHSPRLLAFTASQPIGGFSPGHATARTGDPSPHRRSRHARAAAIRFTPGFACDVCPLRVGGNAS